MAGHRVIEAPARRRSRTLAGVRGGKVRWIAVLDPGRVGSESLPRTLRRLLADPRR